MYKPFPMNPLPEQPPRYVKEGREYLRAEAVAVLKENDLLIDVSPGGLLIGPPNASASACIMTTCKSGDFEIFGKVMIGQYIINPLASEQYTEAIEALCAEENKRGPQVIYNGLNPSGRTIDITPKNSLPVFLLVPGQPQFAIGPTETAKYLSILNQINNGTWAKQIEDIGNPPQTA